MNLLVILLALASVEIFQTSSSSAQVLAPGVRVISGAVLDPSSAAIPGAKVILIGADGALVDQSLTDNAGVFRFNRRVVGSDPMPVRVRCS